MRLSGPIFRRWDRASGRERTWFQVLRALVVLLIAGVLSASEVRAWYAQGQVFVVWRTANPAPMSYEVYRASTALTGTAQGIYVGRVFQPEWAAGRLKLARPNATWTVPSATGGTYTLAADEGLFVHTPHAAAQEWYAVVAQGTTTVGSGDRSTAAITVGYDPVLEPVSCHQQLTGTTTSGYRYSVFAFWSDGRNNIEDARPDVPVTASRGKHGAPHIFAVFAPPSGIPTQPCPATICLHGGGEQGSYWEWNPDGQHYANIGHQPSLGLTIAHDDRLFGLTKGNTLAEDRPTFWFGYWTAFDPMQASNVPDGAVVGGYTLRRLLWIQDWLEQRSPYCIDRERLSILGASMGGMGTNMISRFRPERFSSANCFVPPFPYPPGTSAPLTLGTEAQALKTTEIGPKGAVLTTCDMFFPTCRLSPVMRDFCLTRVYNGRYENLPQEWDRGWDRKVQAFRAIDTAAMGVHLYWDYRDHNPADWSTDDHSTPEHDVGQWIVPVRTERGSVDYQARYRASASYPGFWNDDQDPATPGRQPDPGNGTPADGTPWGTWGGYCDWDGETIVDTATRWECTVFLVGTSPVAVDNFPGTTATASLAIRKPQAFWPAPGTNLNWELRRLSDGTLVSAGHAAADADGLVAIPGLELGKDPDRRRLAVWPSVINPRTITLRLRSGTSDLSSTVTATQAGAEIYSGTTLQHVLDGVLAEGENHDAGVSLVLDTVIQIQFGPPTGNN